MLGVAIAIFSYIGIETVAVAAGEASDPQVAVPRATRATFGRLALFYIGGIAVLVGVMPWTQAGLTESPFVRVFETVRIPHAGALMNFVVLTAALSSMNSNLYLTSRMIFSLSRGGYAPGFIGRVNSRGVPLAALLVSSIGMVIALLVELRFQETRVCVYAGRIVFWRAFWLVHYFPYASGFPAEAGAGGARIADAICAAQRLDFCGGIAGDCGRVHFDLVDSGNEDHDLCGIALAGADNSVLFFVGARCEGGAR